MNNYSSSGETIEAVAPAGGVIVNNGVVIGSVFGVAAVTAAATVKFSLRTEGVVDLTKEAALAITVGDLVYWDDTAKEVDKTATNTPIGVCVEKDAVGGDATVRVKLDGRSHEDRFGPLGCKNVQQVGVANVTATKYIVPARDIRITAIKAIAKVSPGSAAGVYTLAMDSGGDNLLSAATFDLELLVGGTLSAVPVTGTAADLDIDANVPIELTFVSDNADLVDGDVTIEILFRDR